MAAAETTSWIAPLATLLAPVIVGGLIGVGGALLGPWFLEVRKETSYKKKKRAEKFEELVEAIYEHEHWLQQTRSHWLFGNPAPPTMSPMAKVHAISAVYFPQFEVRVTELEAVARRYEIWMTERPGKSNQATDGFSNVYGPYWTKVTELIRELREYARRELQ